VWVVLTASSFALYRSPSDVDCRYEVPMRACAVSRRHPIDTVFTVAGRVSSGQADDDGGGSSASATGSGGPLGKRSAHKEEVELLADNEKELRSWLLILNALASVGQGETSSFAERRSAANNPVKFVNMDLRKAWLNEKNVMGETPLLALARFKNRHKDGSLRVPTARVVQLTLWLLENGCDINSQNKNLQTALHVSIRYGNIDMASCLVAKGCDVTLRNSDGYTALEMCTSDIKTVLSNSASAFGYSDTSLSVPRDMLGRKLKNFSYLTMNFHKHSQIATKHR
jgi:hypothetical protein